MKHVVPPHSPPVGGYFVCRLGGTPPELAQTELGLTSRTVAALEALFQARPGGGGDAMKPRFARHDAHVAAVVAAGGYPVLRRP